MLHAGFVPGYRHDLKVRLCVDLAESLHEVGVCDNVEYLVSEIMPRVLIEMAFWEFLSKEEHPDGPEQLIAHIAR